MTFLLKLVDLPLPEPEPRQVRIKAAASTVNPIDISTCSGALAEAGLLAPRAQYGAGWDVAGTIDATVAGVSRFDTGDVVGLRDLLFAVPGAHAEYVVLDERAVAPAPRSVSPAKAATLPLNALTADRSLDLAGVEPGQTLMVTGAGGGVGGFALELARLRGVRTIAVASPTDESRVRELGADEFVPRTDALAAAVRSIVPGGVDAVIDAAVLGITAHDALRGEGTFVALVRPFAPPPIRGTSVLVQEEFADGAHLTKLAALVDLGLLSLPAAETYALSDVAAAHVRRSAGRRGAGRIVLTMQ